MQSLRELYKIGRGPSSSHTIGPEKICTYVNAHWADEYMNIREAYPDFDTWVQAKNPEIWIENEVERFTDLDLTNND